MASGKTWCHMLTWHCLGNRQLGDRRGPDSSQFAIDRDLGDLDVNAAAAKVVTLHKSRPHAAQGDSTKTAPGPQRSQRSTHGLLGLFLGVDRITCTSPRSPDATSFESAL